MVEKNKDGYEDEAKRMWIVCNADDIKLLWRYGYTF